MAHTFLISRSKDTDTYAVWAFNPDDPQHLLTRVTTVDPDATFSHERNLTPIGGYLLAWGPLDKSGTYLPYELFRFDPSAPDPLDATPVQSGSWRFSKFAGHYIYKDGPGQPQVTALQLLGVTGYVLSFLPTQGRGSFALWNFDAYASSPGGSNDPLPDTMADPDAFPTIRAGHTLLPIENYVIDFVAETGECAVHSFDPQQPNPLTHPPLFHQNVSLGGQTRLAIIGGRILAWSPTDRSYTLYTFAPNNPFGTPTVTGTLPATLDPTHTLTAVQPNRPIDADHAQTPGTLDFMRSRIKHVVTYVVESRSFDNVVGWLYEKEDVESRIHWVPPTPGTFEGASPSNTNTVDGETFRQHKYKKGEVSTGFDLNWPPKDPFHGTADSINQQWSEGYTAYTAGKPSDMGGFVSNNGTKTVMAGFAPAQLRVLNGLAKHFGVSDQWYCSEAGGTTTNRATLATGSALDITTSYEVGEAYDTFPTTPRRQSLWKVLANNGFLDWKIYYSMEWLEHPYTYHLYLKGQVPSIDAQWSGFVQPIDSFHIAAANGSLPRFSFLEPVWYTSDFMTSYHPSGNVVPGENALNQIYEAIKNGPGWEHTLLIISFSKGGGVYDHVGAKKLQKAWPHDGVDGYEFDVSGARVPTIVVSPLVKRNTVFRSGDADVPFDATSLAATVLSWYGIPRSRWGLGERVPSAPTFETVLQETTPRTHAPTLPVSRDKTYPPGKPIPLRYPIPLSGAWKGAPDNGEWTDPSNWELPPKKEGVPNDTVSFGASRTTELSFALSSASTVYDITFSADAPAYTLHFTEDLPESPTLTIAGKGVINRSPNPQTFAVKATSFQDDQVQLQFINSASAGDNVVYSAGPATPLSPSGGIIAFTQQSNAGSATFTASTGAHPCSGTTVGAEIRFLHDSSAHQATFTLSGTTGTDTDTFGNVVFHHKATAHQATFVNNGGTVGDGGNTQFFGQSSADQATFTNLGATGEGANGGDVAFDGIATAAQATLVNKPATHPTGNGGVTSFNNNPPYMAKYQGATAGNATITNEGAQAAPSGTGGHTKFTGAAGAGSAGYATIDNHGTATANGTGAGFTQFFVNGHSYEHYRPTAGYATLTNHPGACSGAQAGNTLFTTLYFETGAKLPPGPLAGHATIINLGGTATGAPGGYTTFENTSTADHATLIAHGGTHGGAPGRILFSDTAEGGQAVIKLPGGTLDICGCTGPLLSFQDLEMDGGTLEVSVGEGATALNLVGAFRLQSETATFDFSGVDLVQEGQAYTLMTAASGLENLDSKRFVGNAVNGLWPMFSVVGEKTLQVTFVKT
jgi:phospholipase C